ncbi:unnamed protein product [Camellia sinensis]
MKSDEKVITLLDSVLRTLAWLSISVYLHTHFVNSGEPKLPISLRIWWGFYCLISCYSLVIDFFFKKEDQSFPTQLLVSDVISTVSGLSLCFVGFLGKKASEETLLQEPLLNASSNLTSNGRESNKSSVGGIVAPCSNASIFSILTFSWMGRLIGTGYKKALDLDDVPQLDGVNSVKGAFQIFKTKLAESDSGSDCKITTIKLVKAVIFTTWKEILITALLALVYAFASYVGPYLIDTFVQYLNGHQTFENEGLALVSAFFIAKLVECLSQRHWAFMLQKAGIRARAVLVAMIYKKGLTISGQAKKGHTSGEIINFMSVDAERVADFSWYMHDPWLVILQVGLAMVILYKNLGVASIAALVATVLVMLVNVPIGRFQEKFQEKLMASKDKRMKATSEMLRNMRILKLQAWEMTFLSKVIELRNTEEGWLRKYMYTAAMTTFVFWGAPTFVSVITFGACLLLGIPLESGNILSALATFKSQSMMIQTKVSLDRIASFLRLDDLPHDVLEKLPRGSSDIAIEIIDGNFSWDVSSPNPTLKDINIKVPRGMRVAVCGTVGSGKSSLLSCILGEVPKISGTVKLCGTKAYVAQSPWIQSGKIEENILFGEEMDRERYEKVLEACSLKKDLEILSFGDQTVIGERGINLSGGQKQRIQIARALYQDADIYLFDDPFSALDAHTGSHLFKQCLLGLLDSKTVIFVTHQVEFLPAADLILVMKDGRITQAGKYNDILNSGSDFMELVGAHKEALSALDSTVAESCSEKLTISEEDGGLGSVQKSVQKEEAGHGQNGKPDDTAGQKGQIVLQIGNNYWMAWATPVSKDVEAPVGGSTLMIVYVTLAIGSSFCVLARSVLLVTAGASTDQSAVDLNIPFQVGSFAFSMIQLLGIIAVMSQVAWQQYYIPSARELARLVGVCKAPVIQHFAETISGSTTIRSFDQEPRFKELSMKLIDAHSRPKFYSAAAMEWLCFRLDVLSSITFAFCLVFLISMPTGAIDPSVAGLAVTYGLNLNMLQVSVIWNLCNLENKIISVERIFQYTSIQSESPLVIEENRPGSQWPSHGDVHIQDLQVRYAPNMPLVLRGLTCTFPGGMKTGIVGRTGSGKSTLIQTLFRIVEPAAGQILIDGIVISSIGLHDLRSRLSIIPQDPTMFEGIVRSNLDPLEEHTDEQIWEALDKCQLGDEVRKKEGKLDSAVTENGENWSMGQRQLVCLGRVLLKKSKVLVLDEATASVDTAIDNLIQQMLKQHFTDCTVLTIAHRITSVVDSDMVLLLDHGLIEEFDSPTKLLENKSSLFAKLVAEYSTRSNSNFKKSANS